MGLWYGMKETMAEKKSLLIQKLSKSERLYLLSRYNRIHDQISDCESGNSCTDAHWCGDELIDWYERYGVECKEEKLAQEEFESGGSGNDYFWVAEELLFLVNDIRKLI